MFIMALFIIARNSKNFYDRMQATGSIFIKMESYTTVLSDTVAISHV